MARKAAFSIAFASMTAKARHARRRIAAARSSRRPWRAFRRFGARAASAEGVLALARCMSRRAVFRRRSVLPRQRSPRRAYFAAARRSALAAGLHAKRAIRFGRSSGERRADRGGARGGAHVRGGVRDFYVDSLPALGWALSAAASEAADVPTRPRAADPVTSSARDGRNPARSAADRASRADRAAIDFRAPRRNQAPWLTKTFWSKPMAALALIRLNRPKALNALNDAI